MTRDTFNDSLNDLWTDAAPAPVARQPLPAAQAPRLHVVNGGDREVFTEACPKCRGTGRFRGYSGRDMGECFACKGEGKNTFKTSPQARAKSRESADKRRAREAQAKSDAIGQFIKDHPAVYAWMDNSTFPFAIAMRDALTQWGSLTERQLAACYSAVAKLEAAKAARKAQDAKKSVSLDGITKAFDAASKTAKAPILRLPGLKLSLAKAHSANPGAIYVARTSGGDNYLGKIVGGQFQPTRECTDADVQKLQEAAVDPAAAAIRYGRETGSCACCGRELTDPVSVERGIGPICADKFGW